MAHILPLLATRLEDSLALVSAVSHARGARAAVFFRFFARPAAFFGARGPAGVTLDYTNVTVWCGGGGFEGAAEARMRARQAAAQGGPVAGDVEAYARTLPPAAQRAWAAGRPPRRAPSTSARSATGAAS